MPCLGDVLGLGMLGQLSSLPRSPAAFHDYLLPLMTTCHLPTTTCCLPRLPATSLLLPATSPPLLGPRCPRRPSRNEIVDVGGPGPRCLPRPRQPCRNETECKTVEYPAFCRRHERGTGATCAPQAKSRRHSRETGDGVSQVDAPIRALATFLGEYS